MQGCRGLEVLVVGAGPAGLVSAIELTLMGASVRVVEKRPYLTRNNVLHLWQCTVQEVREAGSNVLRDDVNRCFCAFKGLQGAPTYRA